MPDLIYYCRQEENTCPRKEECRRYMECTQDKSQATLFKVSCTENNNYVLFIQHKQEENINEQNPET